MKRTQKTVLAFITAITIGAMASAYATGMGRGPGGAEAMAGKGMSANHSTRIGSIDSHLATLKSDLKISSDQEAAWEAFANAVTQPKTARPATTATTAPDRIDERVAFMKQGVAAMETVADAMKLLYSVLTPEQKEIFDGHFGQ